MTCIVSDRLCLHFSELDRFEVLVVRLHGRELRIRFCLVDIKICDVFLIACGIDRTFYLAEGPDVPRNIDPLAIAMVGTLRSHHFRNYLITDHDGLGHRTTLGRILISLPGVADGRILLRCRCADIGFRFSALQLCDGDVTVVLNGSRDRTFEVDIHSHCFRSCRFCDGRRQILLEQHVIEVHIFIRYRLIHLCLDGFLCDRRIRHDLRLRSFCFCAEPAGKGKHDRSSQNFAGHCIHSTFIPSRQMSLLSLYPDRPSWGAVFI